MPIRFSVAVSALLLGLLAFVPLFAMWADEPFAVTFFTRVLVFALAAISLNLILGFGGMVSFGHALYLGLGGYAVGILAHHGVDSGWMHLLVTLGCCVVVGLLTGIVSLRTSGIAFIMITLAFAQMFYFLFVSLRPYGGDDGLSIVARSRFGPLDLGDPTMLYVTALVLVLVALAFTHRLVHARFGMVLQGSRINERRMRALGFPTTRYRLLAYVIACVACGIAGLLNANLTGFVAPAYLAWTVSGELIVMVVLGGMGTVMGPLVGALALLLTEELLKGITEHWMMILGPLIVLVVLTARRGIHGGLLDLDARRARRAPKPADERADGLA